MKIINYFYEFHKIGTILDLMRPRETTPPYTAPTIIVSIAFDSKRARLGFVEDPG